MINKFIEKTLIIKYFQSWIKQNLLMPIIKLGKYLTALIVGMEDIIDAGVNTSILNIGFSFNNFWLL